MSLTEQLALIKELSAMIVLITEGKVQHFAYAVVYTPKGNDYHVFGDHENEKLGEVVDIMRQTIRTG